MENEIPILTESYKRRIFKALHIREKDNSLEKRIILRQFIREAIAERLFRYENPLAPEGKVISPKTNSPKPLVTDDGASSDNEPPDKGDIDGRD
jgi:hypothetical protein